MPKIKTRDAAKGPVRAIDKSAVIAKRMKDAFVRTKDKAEHSLYAAESSPDEYAAEHISDGTQTVLSEASYLIRKQGSKSVKEIRAAFADAKEKFKHERMTEPLKQRVKAKSENISHTSADSAPRYDGIGSSPITTERQHQAVPGHHSVRSTDKPVRILRQERHTSKALDRTKQTIQQSVRPAHNITERAAKSSVKIAERSIKTAEKSAYKTFKTTKTTGAVTGHSAQAAARSTKVSVRTARETTKATTTVTKAATSAVKAIIEATKGLISSLATGATFTFGVIIIICLLGLFLASCFGIFFSGEDTGTGMTMRTAVQEINEDYESRLDTIKAENPHEVLEMVGSRAVWPEVLAVYAVNTTTDPVNGQEVASVDESKIELLRDIFWQMHKVDFTTASVTEEQIIEADDGEGNIIQTSTPVTRTYLYITVSHKTAEEMADFFNFNVNQRRQLAELLADENRSLWSAVLYGMGTGDSDIVSVALSQVGNVGGQPYWSWYGFGSRVEWCACFVSWCADQCGYIEAGIIPKFAGCVQGSQWFMDRGLWQDRNYIPNPGDIIFFDWNDGGQDGEPDHVGIVQKVEDGFVYTVEGNSGNACKERQYAVGYYEIYGYGTPAY